MSRLTKEIRDNMARKLVAHRYADEAKELARLNRTLAERVYTHMYPKKVLDAMAVIEKEFPSAFAKGVSIFVNAGGFKVELGRRLASRWVQIEQVEAKQLVLAGDRYGNHNLTDNKLIEEVKDFATRWRALDDVCATAYHEAISVLNTMTTGKKLADAWPEAMPVIGDLIPEGERTLPVVQVSAINAKFKLPPKKAA